MISCFQTLRSISTCATTARNGWAAEAASKAAAAAAELALKDQMAAAAAAAAAKFAAAEAAWALERARLLAEMEENREIVKAAKVGVVQVELWLVDPG